MGLPSLLLAAGIVWTGIVPANHLGGRPASPGYLQGKVFLVDCRDYATADLTDLERLEDFWESYKGKPFVLVGSHRGGDIVKAKARIREAGISYPVYAEAGFEAPTFEGVNGLSYVINGGGRMAVKAKDINRAYESAVTSITWFIIPETLPHYRKLIEYERGLLPGLAYNHVKEMLKLHPVEAEHDYGILFREWERDEAVKRLAKLENTVSRIKDFGSNRKRNGQPVKISRDKVEKLVAGAEDLKGHADAHISQEAKNCVAELKWALANLE